MQDEPFPESEQDPDDVLERNNQGVRMLEPQNELTTPKWSGNYGFTFKSITVLVLAVKVGWDCTSFREDSMLAKKTTVPRKRGEGCRGQWEAALRRTVEGGTHTIPKHWTPGEAKSTPPPSSPSHSSLSEYDFCTLGASSEHPEPISWSWLLKFSLS